MKKDLAKSMNDLKQARISIDVFCWEDKAKEGKDEMRDFKEVDGSCLLPSAYFGDMNDKKRMKTLIGHTSVVK